MACGLLGTDPPLQVSPFVYGQRLNTNAPDVGLLLVLRKTDFANDVKMLSRSSDNAYCHKGAADDAVAPDDALIR